MTTYWKIAAQSDYDMFSKYKYLIVNLAFSRLGFWSGNFLKLFILVGCAFFIIVYLYLFDPPVISHFLPQEPYFCFASSCFMGFFSYIKCSPGK